MNGYCYSIHSSEHITQESILIEMSCMSINASNICLNNNESMGSRLTLLNKQIEISKLENNTVYWQSNGTLRDIQMKHRVLPSRIQGQFHVLVLLEAMSLKLICRQKTARPRKYQSVVRRKLVAFRKVNESKCCYRMNVPSC
jgi:hypothetical protein